MQAGMLTRNSKITVTKKQDKQIQKKTEKQLPESLFDDQMFEDQEMEIADEFTEKQTSKTTSKTVSRVTVFQGINNSKKGNLQKIDTSKYTKTGRSDVFVPLTCKAKNQTIKQQIYGNSLNGNGSISKKGSENKNSQFTDKLIQRCLFQSDDKKMNKSYMQLSNPPKPGKRVQSPSFAYEQLFSMHTPKNKKSSQKKIFPSQNKSNLYQSKNKDNSGCKRCNERSLTKQQAKHKNHCDMSPKRTLERFLETQAQYTANRQAKISQKRRQIQKVQQEQYTHRPLIDKNSTRIIQSKVRMQERMDSMFISSATLKNRKPAEVYQRLSCVSRDKSNASKNHSFRRKDQEYLFSPKILSRSKQMKRTSNVSQLLYNDAKRRQQKQKFVRQQINSRRSLTPNINKNTSKLVLRKIKAQFDEFFEGITQNDQYISAILAISILGQLFNVDLNPTKSEQKQDLCHRVLKYLVDQPSTQKSECPSDKAQLNDQNDDQTNVNIKKLWKFIEVLVSYNDNPIDKFTRESELQQRFRFFTNEEQQQIYENFSDFYSNRVAREKKSKTPQRLSFQPQTLQRSKKMAVRHRQRVLTQVNQFVQNQNAVKLNNFQFLGSILNGSVEVTQKMQNNHSAFQSENKTQNEEKSIKIEDLFIAEFMKRKTENQNRKRQLQEQKMVQCTFKPKTNKNYKKDNTRKLNIKIVNRIKSRENIHGDRGDQAIFLNQIEASKEDRKKIPLSVKNFATKFNSVKNKQNESKPNVKNLEKAVLRMSQGRMERQLSNSSKLRAYPDPRQVQNYQEYQRRKKQQFMNLSKRLKGYCPQI